MELIDSIKNRFSPRIFSDKMIDNETVELLIEAARWASSSRNSQPWRFIIGYKGDDNWNRILSCLDGFNQEWAQGAPVLILVLAQVYDRKTLSNRRHAFYDVGLCIGNLINQSMNLGIYVRNMGGFSVSYSVSNFNVPKDYEPLVCLAVGYPGNVTDISHPHYVPIGNKRERRKLEQIIFSGKWEDMD